MTFRQLIPALLMCLVPLLVMAQSPKVPYSISYQAIQQMLSAELEQSGAGDKVEAIISNVKVRTLMQSPNPLSARVAFIDFDERTQRFEAEITIYEEDMLIKTQSLSGRFSALQEVPVLKHRIRAGEVISEDNLTHEYVAQNRLRHNVMDSAETLTGMAARRAIRAGAPIGAHEVEAPRIVKKGDLLSLRYVSNHLEIKTVGEAMQDGALGSHITLRNADSGQMLRATIIAPGVAEIRRPMLLSQNVKKRG